MAKCKVLIFVPTMGDLSMNSILALRLAVIQKHTKTANLKFDTFAGSLLPRNFNEGWCKVLRDPSITHFLMIHSDITPMNYTWVDDLLSIMDATEADVVSVVSPIKDSRGLTSTAKDTHIFWPQRLTMKEIKQLPETFEAELINTGFMLVDMRIQWIRELNPPFELIDKIMCDYEHNAYPMPTCIPEDWGFSRKIREGGGKIVATRSVPIIHFGMQGYSNQEVWGQATDTQNKKHISKSIQANGK